MGLTRPITRELTQILPRQLWQGLGLGKVEQILLDARAALNIHPEQQVGATYLAEQTPTIAGVVEDETPTHKDRTRLSCRASDFDGINQSFSGGNTSTSKTQLSAAVWIRPDQVSSAGGIFGEYDSGSTDIGWLINQSSNDFVVYISEDGGNTNWKSYQVSNLLVVGEWLHIAFTFDLDVGGGINELLIYVNGKEVTPTKTADVNLTAIFDTTVNIEVGKETTIEFDGQIQQPLIYEGVWSAAQVRDLYLQQTDDIQITYGWFLDADTAHPLTSSSPTLTPANSPDLYEDDAIGGGDWLNEKGWNNSGTLAPKRWDEELDSLGNAAADSTSFGVARRDGQLRGDSNAVSLNGINQFGTVANSYDFSGDDWVLSGYVNFSNIDLQQAILSQQPETVYWLYKTAANDWALYFNSTAVTFSVGTISAGIDYYFSLSKSGSSFTLSITANGVTTSDTQTATQDSVVENLTIGKQVSSFLNGSIWGLKLDHANGFEIPVSEKTGDISYDVSGNGKDCTWQNSPERVDQDSYHWNEAKGYGQYELITNGTFDSDITGWTDNSGGAAYIEWDAGRLSMVGDGIDFVNADQQITTVVGETYTLLYDRISGTGTVRCRIGTTLGGVDLLDQSDSTPDSSFTLSFTATTTTTYVRFRHGSNSTNYIDNVSIKPTALIPALAAGTNDANGYPLTNPAGPWLYEGDETYVDFDVVANANQWLEQRWQDTEGDGVGYLTLDSAITLSGAFDVEFLHYASSYSSAESIIGHSSETSQIGFSATKYFIRVLNGGSSDNTIAAPSINQWHSVKIARDSSDIVTATIDGTETTLFSGAAQSGDFVINQIFKGTLGIFTGNVRNVKITDNTTIIMDFDSLIDIDLSSSVNHATETATDITFNRLTDTSYTAGDVVEQPFSVNDDTSGRVSELIQFTFPVTTISSTPTISQTVFEDGNTVTQDGILISES